MCGFFIGRFLLGGASERDFLFLLGAWSRCTQVPQEGLRPGERSLARLAELSRMARATPVQRKRSPISAQLTTLIAMDGTLRRLCSCPLRLCTPAVEDGARLKWLWQRPPSNI